jgi:hypothetical protein
MGSNKVWEGMKNLRFADTFLIVETHNEDGNFTKLCKCSRERNFGRFITFTLQ